MIKDMLEHYKVNTEDSLAYDFIKNVIYCPMDFEDIIMCQADLINLKDKIISIDEETFYQLLLAIQKVNCIYLVKEEDYLTLDDMTVIQWRNYMKEEIYG